MAASKQPTFGELLRDSREETGISLRALAAAADMDPAYLSKIENGKTGEPKEETVEKLALALCGERQLDTTGCDRLRRRLLVAAGHLLDKEKLIDDLADRFAARLRDEHFPESLIDEALARVPLPTMRAVLLGEEKLEVGRLENFSAGELWARQNAGEDVITVAEAAPDDWSKATATDSASSYLARHAGDFSRHADEFKSRRRQQRTRSDREPRRKFRAGRDAEIDVHRPLNKEQERQLRLFAKLIESILEEK